MESEKDPIYQIQCPHCKTNLINEDEDTVEVFGYQVVPFKSVNLDFPIKEPRLSDKGLERLMRVLGWEADFDVYGSAGFCRYCESLLWKTELLDHDSQEFECLLEGTLVE